MATVLTAASVERLKPDVSRRREVPDAGLPGLYLIIQPSGMKSWALRYRHGGKPRKMTLGGYPQLSLVLARESARNAVHLIEQGRDPGTEKVENKRRARESDADQDLVCGAVESFLKRYVRPKGNRYAAETERLFNLHVLPRWKNKRLEEIKRKDVVELLDRVVDGGAPIAANRVLAAVRKFFNWVVDRGLLEASPCSRVKAPTEEKSRDRVLSDDEIRLAWLASEKSGLFGQFVRALMLTAQRRDEVAQMVLAEVDQGRALWSIPGERTKNGLTQDVPLSPHASAVLSEIAIVKSDAGYVFTSNGRTPISGYAKGKAKLDTEMLAIGRARAEEAGGDPEKMTIPSWRLHDLRRTAASGMARLGYPVHVIEAVLNHRSGQISGVAAVYNRYKYLEEKRAALSAWGNHVAALMRQST